MRRPTVPAVLAACAAAVIAWTGAAGAATAAPTSSVAAPTGATVTAPAKPAAKTTTATYSHACSTAVAKGFAHCDALVRTDAGAKAVQPNALPAGFGPADLQARVQAADLDRRRRPDRRDRRRLRTTRTPSPTWPSTASHVRAAARAPPPTAASARSNQNGADLAAADARTPAGPGRSPSTSTWSRRSARTATSCWSRPTRASLANLGTAVNRAVTLGAKRVTNSYGGGDSVRHDHGSALQPPGRRDHREHRRRRLRRRVPGVRLAT